MQKLYKVGIIGLGRQTIEDHLPAALKANKVKLVGVCDSNKKVSKEVAKKYDIPSYESCKDFFRNQKLDFVIIVLPHYAHFDAVKEAINNKVHILKEKPFAMNLKEAKEIQKLARTKKIHIMTTLQRRFNPIYGTFFQLIDKIGNPFYIDAKYTIFVDNPHSGWRGNKKLAGGGCLIDMGYHMIDLFIWYFGLPEKIFSKVSFNAKENDSYDAEDTARVIFNYNKKDLWGSLLVSRVISPKQERIDIYGTHGIIHLERGKIERLSCNGEIQESLIRHNSWPSAATDQIEYFCKVIEGKKKNITTPMYNLEHIAFITACYESNRLGKYFNPHSLL